MPVPTPQLTNSRYTKLKARCVRKLRSAVRKVFWFFVQLCTALVATDLGLGRVSSALAEAILS